MTRGFTLIELLVSTGLSLLLAASAATAFVQLRAMQQRREAILVLHQRSETLHLALVQRLTQLTHHGVFVADARDTVVRSGSARPTLRLLWLRGKEDINDGDSGTIEPNNGYTATWRTENTDQLWQLLEYRPEERALYMASSRTQRSFTVDAANTAMLNGSQDLRGHAFAIMPQPRRSLAGPDWWLALDGNQLFPDLTVPAPTASDRTRPSLAHSDDRGDWGGLLADLRPLVSGLSELTVQIESQDGTQRTLQAGAVPAPSSSASGSDPWIADGLRHDGALIDGAGLRPATAGWTWSTTAAARRPRLLRLRWTLTDQRSGIAQIFTHAVLLPGPAGPPPP